MIAGMDRLRQMVLDADNEACFIEREELLRRHAAETLRLPECERYIREFEVLLASLSTPVDPAEILVGRMVEGRWPHPGEPFSRVGLGSEGHQIFDYPALLDQGLAGMVAEARAAAEADPTANKRFFAGCAERALAAVAGFARRYAAAARAAGNRRAALALERVPDGPPRDFFEALQAIVFMHFILSACVGSRDFAFGRMDQYLLPWYERDLAEAKIDRGEAVDLLACFMLKCQEMAGTATDDFRAKPTPCQASKQYLTVGGRHPGGATAWNEFSAMLIDAAGVAGMPQPTLNLRLDPEQPEWVWALAARAALLPNAVPNFFNDATSVPLLLRNGVAAEDAWNLAYTGCNRVDLPGKLYNIMRRIDHFCFPVIWMREELLAHPEADSLDGLVEIFRARVRRELLDYARQVSDIFTDAPCFRLESLAYPHCRAAAADIYQDGVQGYRWLHHMFGGLATIADSFTAIDRYVFREKRLSLAGFNAMLENNFAGDEEFRQELLHRTPKFGGGVPEDDRMAQRLAGLMLDAADEAARLTGFITVSSFYSLSHHVGVGARIGATPDGRLAGEPFSENQSPVYGTDTGGPTALLRSVASLPLRRTICGGLNLKLGCRPDEETVINLLKTFFGMGGVHLGFTIVDRATLQKAQLHPDEYRTLCVRKYGFSEFFVSLSPEFQKELIDRTEY